MTNNGLTLIDYLNQKYPFLKKTFQDNNSDFFNYLPIYTNLLHCSIVYDEPSRCDHAVILRLSSGNNSYPEFIDAIVGYLVSKKSSNILINGYLDPSNNAAWSSHTFNPYVNFQINDLKGSRWRRLCSEVGRQRFADLLLNTKCFVADPTGSIMQIFGSSLSFTGRKRLEINKYKMLFRTSRSSSDNIQFLNSDIVALIQSIYPHDDIIGRKHFPKKYRGIREIIRKIQKNDQKLNYSMIYKNLCPFTPVDDTQSNLEHVTDFATVVRFVLVILGKLVPFEIWGTSKNRAVAFKKTAAFLKAGKHEGSDIRTLTLEFALTDMTWLGKSAQITSRQDYDMRFMLLSNFLNWLFSDFVCKLVREFWHVTDSTRPVPNAVGGLLYYNHLTWNKLTRQWLKDYIARYMIEAEIATNQDLQKFQRFNYGRLRLIPKANDFRVLCIPIKTPSLYDFKLPFQNFQENKFEYLNHINNVIGPVRDLIREKARFQMQKMGQHHPRCISTSEVVLQIKQYKLRLKEEGIDDFSKVCAVKFDMKHCYDRLNQFKIIECFEKLFEDDDDGKPYFVRKFMELKGFKQRLRKLHSFIKDMTSVEELNILESGSLYESHNRLKVLIDRNRTIKLTKLEILDIIQGQVLHSTILIEDGGRKLLKRKEGVFQGLTLLGTFCDLVYNALVDIEFDFLLKAPESSLFIRLADDFLFLSTLPSQCKEVYDLVTSDIAEKYGAYVNQEKTQWINTDGTEPKDSFQFIGLRINTSTLEVMKDTTNHIACHNKSSFKAVYSYLGRTYRMRLFDYFLDLDLNSIETVMHNIINLLTSILDCILREIKTLEKNEKFLPENLCTLLLELLLFTLEKYEVINSGIHDFDIIVKEFQSCVRRLLSKRYAKFDDVISWIEDL